MRTKTIEQIVKHSIVYGYAVTQPFLLYVNPDPLSQENTSPTLPLKDNSKVVRHMNYPPATTKAKDAGVYFSYKLPKKQALKGVQSSHDVKLNDEEKNYMNTHLKKEKQNQFKKIKNEIQTIQYGEKSANVKKVQKMLAQYNYYEGEIDSIYGPLTEAAIQKANQENVLPKKESIETKQSEPTRDPITEENNHQSIEQSEKPEETVQLNVQNPTNIVQEAKQFLGTPYVWGGTTPNGFDCSGFIQYVYSNENRTLPRTVREIWNYASVTNTPSIGDLVFFETYQPGPSHLGIYLGNGDFIHAGSSNGVTISNYNENPYWSKRYIGAKSI